MTVFLPFFQISGKSHLKYACTAMSVNPKLLYHDPYLILIKSHTEVLTLNQFAALNKKLQFCCPFPV